MRRLSRSIAKTAGVLAVMATLTAGAAVPAAAQDREMQALIQRLNALEGDLRELQKQFYRGEVPPPSGGPSATAGVGGGEGAGQVSAARQAEALVRLDRLEVEIRELTGRIEKIGHEMRQVGDRLDRLVGDVDYRLAELERRLQDGGPAAAAPPPTTAPSPSRAETAEAPDRTAAAPSAAASEALPKGSPMEQYNYASALLRKAQYEEAQRAFEAFLDEHPDDALAGNAHYWLGETYYVRGRYEQAAQAFLEGYRQSPDGSKAPDTLLKLGLTLQALEQKDEACATLRELGNKYPNAGTHIRDRTARARKELACG